MDSHKTPKHHRNFFALLLAVVAMANAQNVCSDGSKPLQDGGVALF
jgi:hypothetical protein